MQYRRLLPLGAILLSVALPSTFADQIVYFVNGKGIVAKSVEKGDKFTILEMEGGGKVGVPTDQILRIEDVVAPAPAAPVVAPAPTVAAPAPATQQVVQAPPVAAAAATVPTTAPGPGLGGHPAGSQNQGLAAATPLDIGGNNATPQVQQRPMPQMHAGPGQAGPGGAALGRMAGGRPNLGDLRNRFAGRPGFGPGGRGARAAMPNRAGSPPPGAQSPPQTQGADQPPQAAAQPQATPAPEQPAAASVEPEDQPPQADDANEQPSDPPAPEEGDSSGNTPGSAS